MLPAQCRHNGDNAQSSSVHLHALQVRQQAPCLRASILVLTDFLLPSTNFDFHPMPWPYRMSRGGDAASWRHGWQRGSVGLSEPERRVPWKVQICDGPLHHYHHYHHYLRSYRPLVDTRISKALEPDDYKEDEPPSLSCPCRLDRGNLILKSRRSIRLKPLSPKFIIPPSHGRRSNRILVEHAYHWYPTEQCQLYQYTDQHLPNFPNCPSQACASTIDVPRHEQGMQARSKSCDQFMRTYSVHDFLKERRGPLRQSFIHGTMTNMTPQKVDSQ